MYPIRPPAVYIHERALATPERRARVERMLAHVCSEREPEVVDDAALSEVSLARGWMSRAGRRTGQWRLQGDPVLVFSAFTWEPAEAITERRARCPGLHGDLLDGAGAWTFRQGRHFYGGRGTVCQDAWELHSAFGCLHRCDYCHIGEFLNLTVNLEELVERLPALLEPNPWLQLLKYDNMTDTIAFEPEYGASELLVGFFAQTDDRYLMLYTKSDNVDHLLPLDHRGHTIVSFTISCSTVAREIEKGTPDTLRRVGAAEKVQQAGYTPRVRLSPIVPIRGWREENAALVRELLPRVRPDVISMDLLGWMDPAAIGEVLDASLLDPRFLEGMGDLFRDGPPGPAYYPSSKHILPHHLRREVYDFALGEIRRRDQRVRVALCNETIEMWAELGPQLGISPEEYVCGCGPTSVPGNPLFA
jgi:hypothetical protein